jgi:hypothetical protein
MRGLALVLGAMLLTLAGVLLVLTGPGQERSGRLGYGVGLDSGAVSLAAALGADSLPDSPTAVTR